MALDRDVVVRAALRLLDDVGLDALTLRKLAVELGVQAPALYWHFENKQALLDEMATTMFRDLMDDYPFDGPGLAEMGWRELLETFARAFRSTLTAYRDGARMAAGTYLTDNSLLAAMERPLQALTAAGFSLRDAVRGFYTVYSFTVGYAIEEQAAQNDPRYAPEHRQGRLDSERYPLTTEASTDLFGNTDAGFEDGLEIIIEGLHHRGSSSSVSHR